MEERLERLINVPHLKKLEISRIGQKMENVCLLNGRLRVMQHPFHHRSITTLLQRLAVGSQLECVGVVHSLSRFEIDNDDVACSVHADRVNEPRVLELVTVYENVREVEVDSTRLPPKAERGKAGFAPGGCFHLLVVDCIADESMNFRAFVPALLQLYPFILIPRKTLLGVHLGHLPQKR